MIEYISTNYYTVKTKRERFILYSKQVLNYEDTISFKHNFQKIETPKSKSSFNFEKSMKRKNITYSLKDDNVIVIKEGRSLRNQFIKRINKHPDKDYLKKVFFNINYDDLDTDLSSIILSSGIIIRSLIISFMSFLSLYFYKDKLYKVELLLYFFLMFFFKLYPFYLYIIIKKLLLKTKLEALDRLSCATFIILGLFPNYVFSLSFIVSLSFSFFSYVQVNKNYHILSMLVLIPVQLFYFYEFKVMNLLLFFFFFFINVISYVLAVLDSVFFSSLSQTFINKFMFSSTKFTVTGKPHILILFLWIIISLKLLQKIEFRYIFCLTLLLYINQNQLLFNPSLIYTQLYIGQGDSAIIKYPFKNEVFILDTGSQKQWRKLQSHLNYYGIKTIHTLLITHPDEDHNGNQENLYEHYVVKNLIEEKGDYKFYNLSINVQNYEDDNDNDESLISRFTINGYTYLSLGDASKHIEEQYLKDNEGLQYHILKIGHHGSDTSSSDAILSHPNLMLVLNSSGLNNMYKHPHHKVLSRITRYMLPFLDTQDVGDVEIKHTFHMNHISINK